MPTPYGQTIQPQILTPGEQDLKVQTIQAQRLTLQALMDKRQAEIKAQADKARRDALVQGAFQRYTRADGSPDFDQIVSAVMREDPDAGLALQTQVMKGREEAAKAAKAEYDADLMQSDLTGRWVQGLTAENYTIGRQKLLQMDPDLAEVLPEQFDPQAITALINATSARSEYNKQKKDAVDLALSGKPDEAVAAKLAIAKEQQDVDDAFEMGAAFGIPDPILDGLKAKYGTSFGPGYAERAKALAIPVVKAAELEGQAEGREITVRGQDIAAATARRGQDIAAATARRGQDVSAATSAVGGTGGAKLSAAAIEKIAGVDQSIGMINDIEQTLPNMSGYIGPVDGRAAKARIATGVGVTEALATFDTHITALKNAVIKATTGAAMSEPEAKRIMGQLPDLSQPEAVFKARLATTRRNLEMLKRRTIELSGGTVEPSSSKTDPLGIRR